MKSLAFAALAAVSLAFLLAGCSAQDRASEAADHCRSAAEDEAGAKVTIDNLESTNTGDLLFDAGITDERDTSDEDAMFTVMGDVTWEDAGKEYRRSMLCMVTYESGDVQLPVSLDLN